MFDLRKYNQNVAVVCEDGRRYTYQEFAQFTEELGAQVPERCLTFILCTNTMESLTGYVSFLNHKIVPVMIDEKLDTELMLQLMEEYKPKYIWCPEKEVVNFKHVDEKFRILNYVLLETKYDTYYELNEKLGLLLTTSGSTGSPKLVRQSYDNIKSNTESIIEYLKIDSNEITITTLPMHYTYGISILNTHLYAGAAIVLTSKSIIQQGFWEMFHKEHITSFGGVPYTFELLNKLNFLNMDLPSLRYMTQAGGRLAPELHKKMAEYAIAEKKEFVVMYGQTEATARMSYLPAENSLAKYGSIGIAIPNGRFEVFDEDGNVILEPEIAGELVYYGENVTLGYAECGEDLSKGDERQGQLITGDMAKFDKDGYFYIVGRKKRFLKIYGSRMNLDEIEKMIRSEFPDTDSVCGGVDDKLFIYITEEQDGKAIKSYVKEKMKVNPAAIKVKVIEEIPRNESGKILYNKLPV